MNGRVIFLQNNSCDVRKEHALQAMDQKKVSALPCSICGEALKLDNI